MLRFISSVLLLLAIGCGSSGEEIDSRTVEVGCGMCRFELEGHQGCYWAVDIGGKVVPVSGSALPEDHENHAPDGMCNVTREAIVSGTLYESHFKAERFDLQPVEPAESPEFTPEDLH